MVREIPLFRPFVAPREEMLPAIEETLYSGYLAIGPRVKEFERKLARLISTVGKSVVATSSCTAALHLALVLAGVKPGDDVVTTPMTAEPTNLAILHAGARPVWADVDSAAGNVTGETVAAAMTSKTRAVMVVHYGGVPAPMHGIVAATGGLPIIEDCAHALLAKYDGRPVGTWGRHGCFSFQAIKHMTTGDGGALLCPSEVKERAKRLRWFGISRHAERTEVVVDEVGWKYNMNDVTAAMGLVQLRHAEEVVAQHRDHAEWFDRELAGVPGLELQPRSELAEPAHWFYTVLVERRDDLQRKLKDHGIQSGQVHRRNDQHEVFALVWGDVRVPRSVQDLPGLEAFWARALHIPCGWWMELEDLERVRDAIKGGW